MKNTTTRRPRRCRCETCDQLYHPTDDHPVFGFCPRCWPLFLRLKAIYQGDGYEAVNARVRAILADPLGQEARAALAREAFFSAIEEADGYQLALIEQRMTRLKKAARREKFTLIRGGRA